MKWKAGTGVYPMVTRCMALIAIGLMAAGSVAFAQDNGNAAPNGNAKPPAMMGQQGGSMMGSMGDQAQMHRMMENCNRMMESRTQPTPPAPDKKS
jgi:hypothetical protein